MLPAANVDWLGKRGRGFLFLGYKKARQPSCWMTAWLSLGKKS
jgi:hypothetical protein